MSSKKSTSKQLNPVAKLALERKKLIDEANAKLQADKEAEEAKIRYDEEKRLAELKAIEDEKDRKRKIKQDKIDEQKKVGTYKTKSEKNKLLKNKVKIDLLKNAGYVMTDTGLTCDKLQIDTIIEPNNNDVESFINSEYRSPILCIMGHVDTGKTKLLDYIRNTNVQENEAGGITQQIGSTFIPYETLLDKSNITREELHIPGLLMIDTPGHEAFINLRSRGSTLCDIAVVVIDIVHGLEQMTIQSINMLVESNIKFIFALNKIDRLFGWSSDNTIDIKLLLEQNQSCIDEFNNRLSLITTQIMENGLNTKLFWENDSFEDTISICPISAKTGDGIPDLISQIVKINQTYLSEQITFKENLECITVEKSNIEGFGSTVDVMLINGTLNKGDEILFHTDLGLTRSVIKNILTPPPNRESRIKSEYIHHNSIKGSMGIKLVANDIDKILIGSKIIIASPEIDTTNSIMDDIPVRNKFQLYEEGIVIFASSQGSLEALEHFLQQSSIPIKQVNLGKIMKKHVNKILISNKSDKKEYSAILAFNVEIDDDAQEFADKNNIKIFSAEIIYHLFDMYTKYKNDIIKERKALFLPDAVFPCSLKILEKHVYNKKSPLIFGVNVLEGSLRIGTPLITSDTKLLIGKVISIQDKGKEIDIASVNSEVCIKIDNISSIQYGRHFDHKNNICSAITRASLDILKDHFKDELSSTDIKLLVKLKKLLL
jgi:translation initiation factor 5B